MLQISGNTLQRVKLKYLAVVFTSGERRNTELEDTRIYKANAVLRELYRFVISKRELSNTAKLSVFKVVFVPIFNYDYESW